ncbi:alpha-amylase family glycosyl hydrolase, partial [Collinsella aerofaciens]
MWAYETTFYQIYPLGFCGAPRENAAPVAEDELAQAAAAANPDAPIMKIAQWADYLQELGVGAVLINPPLESDSHGYDTRSLRHIDRRLGGDADFAAVCETLHAHGIRVVLDAVFNHVGRGFWAFRDVQERKWDSPYKDWFHISFDGDSCYGDGFWYEGWEGHFELVKLNLQNPAVVDYLLESVRRWAEGFGIDGLRLDVAY